MTDTVTIESPDLQRLLRDGLQMDRGVQDRMARALAERTIAWQIELKGPSISAPGEGIWPVGSVLNLGASDERYVGLDDPRGRDSGRSLGAWDVEQSGLNVRATNDAVDAKRRPYAEHVHFAGEPAGQAVDDAFAAFETAMEQAAEDMADIVEQALLRF